MGKKRRSARLEMTSLMDVMFLVLVFFIYCIFDMAVHKGLKVDLPNTAGADEKGERIVITIRADDSMQFNGVGKVDLEPLVDGHVEDAVYEEDEHQEHDVHKGRHLKPGGTSLLAHVVCVLRRDFSRRPFRRVCCTGKGV